VYAGALREILHAFKYQNRRSLAHHLAVLMREVGTDILRGADCAVPVPLHASRLRERGFNQSADLAQHLGLPVVTALRRTRATPPQTGLPAARRRPNVADAFAPAHGLVSLLRPWQSGMLDRWVVGRTVVLVDDVTTTGATLEACARILVQSGAAEVRALTVARA
jgi:ComF family protein